MKDIKNYIEIIEDKVECVDGDKCYHKIKIRKDVPLEGKEDVIIKKYFKEINKNDLENSKLVEEKDGFEVFLNKVKYNMGTIIEDLNILLNS